MNIDSAVTADKVQKLGFVVQLTSFLKQTIRGAYIPVYKLIAKFNEEESQRQIKNINEVFNVLKKNSLIKEVLVNYMNENWVSFHKKTDEYIMEKFSLMLSFSKINHIYCLFDFIWDFVQIINTKIAIKIDKPNLINSEAFRDFLDKTLDALLSEEIENLVQFDFACKDICEYKEYNENESFIKVKHF